MPIWVRTFLFTIFVPGTVAGWGPYWLVTGHSNLLDKPDPAHWLGTIPFLLGLAIYASTAWEFGAKGKGTPGPWDAPRELVKTALHAWVRNPMYIGVLLVILGQAALWESRMLVWYAGWVALGFHVFVLTVEEPMLEHLFGEAYLKYKRDVPRWIPRRPRTHDLS